MKIGKFPFLANGRARAMEERDGLVKMIADAKTDRVLGVHILGPRASDLIAEAALAIEFGLERRGHRPHLPRASDVARSGEGSGARRGGAEHPHLRYGRLHRLPATAPKTSRSPVRWPAAGSRSVR